VSISYLALAATILALSALRAGARVQATLWSGSGQYETSDGFLRDEKRVLGILTGYINGGTSFPLAILKRTYAKRKPDDPPAHIVVISDDGVDTMLQKLGREEGATVAETALHKARGGGTLVLNLNNPEHWEPRHRFKDIGFRVHAVQTWEQLIAFASAFVRENYKD